MNQSSWDFRLNRSTFFVALSLAVCAASLSVVLFSSPDRVGPAVVLLAPGLIFGIIASGNAHDFSPWIVAIGNFGFYFLTIYLVHVVRRRFFSSPR